MTDLSQIRSLAHRCRLAIDGRQLAVERDDEWLTSMSLRHRVSPLVVESIDPTGTVPAAWDELKGDAQAAIELNLRSLAIYSAVSRALAERSIDHLFVKGLALAALAYPKPLQKPSTDIDLLVPRDRLGEAAEALADNGLASVLPSDLRDLPDWHRGHRESIWMIGDTQLDLHTALDWDLSNPFPSASAIASVSLPNGTIIPTLAPAKHFAFLCRHGASSAWFRLKWLVDLYALVRDRTDEELRDWVDAAQKEGRDRSVDLAALMLEAVFDFDRLPFKTPDARTRAMRRLSIAQLSNPVEPTDRLFGTAGIHLTPMLAGSFASSMRQAQATVRSLATRRTIKRS